jgi:uncharacterized membrane protein
VVERNIDALVQRRREQERRKPTQHRVADAVTSFTGSLRFVVLHIVIVTAWIAVNVGVLPIHRFDPTFVILATAASVEAIFLSTFVLISQNRMQAQADARAELDLQISLLGEHEITRLVTLVTLVADRLDIAEAHDPELTELRRDVAPERILDEIHRHQNQPE